MGEEEDGYASSSSDAHPPPCLQSLIEDQASLVLGRSPAVVMKTKHHSAPVDWGPDSRDGFSLANRPCHTYVTCD